MPLHPSEEGSYKNLEAGKILNVQNKKKTKKQNNIKQQKIDAKAYHN